MVFDLVWATAFFVLGSMCSTYKYSMTPLLAVLALENTGVYVSGSGCGNVAPNIEASVDNLLGFCTILRVPYVNPDDHLV